MGREEGGVFRMGNTCIIFLKLKLNKIKKKKKPFECPLTDEGIKKM